MRETLRRLRAECAFDGFRVPLNPFFGLKMRRARTRPEQSALERAVADASLASFPIHNVKQRRLLRSRGAFSRPGGVLVIASVPDRGAGGAPTGALVLLSRGSGATYPHPAGCGASHDAGRSPLGAPPWRFSAGGRASISGIASGSVQRAPRSQVVMPGGRCPGPPEPAVTSRGRRTSLPAPPTGPSLEDAPHERGWRTPYYKPVT